MLAKSRKIVISAMVFLMISATLSGCGGGAGFSTLLRIAGVSTVLPNNWSSSGGLVRLLVDIVAGDAIKEVIARITKSGDSSPAEVILTRNIEGKFEGTFQAEENPSEVAPTTYTAVVVAEDTAGNVATSEPVQVEVPTTDEAPQ